MRLENGIIRTGLEAMGGWSLDLDHGRQLVSTPTRRSDALPLLAWTHARILEHDTDQWTSYPLERLLELSIRCARCGLRKVRNFPMERTPLLTCIARILAVIAAKR